MYAWASNHSYFMMFSCVRMPKKEWKRFKCIQGYVKWLRNEKFNDFCILPKVYSRTIQKFQNLYASLLLKLFIHKLFKQLATSQFHTQSTRMSDTQSGWEISSKSANIRLREDFCRLDATSWNGQVLKRHDEKFASNCKTDVCVSCPSLSVCQMC